MRFFILIIIITILIPAASIFSISRTLTIEEAVEISLENNLSLQSDRIQLAMSKRLFDTKWNTYMPSLSARTSLRFSNSGTFGTFDPSWGLSFGLSGSLSLSKSKVLRTQKTVLEYERGAISLATASRTLEREIREMFYGLILSERRIDLIEQNIETAHQRLTLAEEDYNSGFVTELEVLNNRLTLQKLEASLEGARISRDSDLMDFKAAMGIDIDDTVNLEGTIDADPFTLDPDVAVKEYSDTVTSIQQLLKERAIIENDIEISFSENYLPSLSFSYSFSPSLSEPFSSSWISGDSWSKQNSLSMGLSIPLDSLYPGSAGRTSIENSRDSLSVKDLEIMMARKEIAIDIRSRISGIDDSLRTLDVMRRTVELSEKVYDLTQNEYEAGLADYIAVEQANVDLQNARLDFLTEKYNYQVKLLDLRYFLGLPLGGS